jgi:glycosyltransferase involved in cell wall biosynthesis
MRIVQLTPGTGSFYCGTCLRDNALVLGLRQRGHDALLVPMYLHPMLDEASTSGATPVLFGGVNVYLQHKLGLFRKTPRWLDRLFDAPALLRAAAKGSSMTTARDLAEITISTLRGEEGPQAKEVERLCDWIEEHHPADVLCLSNILLVGLARRLKQRTGAPVVCTLQGEDAFLDSFPEPWRTQAWDLIAERAADCAAFIAPSRYYGELMTRRCRLPADKVEVVYNGILLDGYGPADPQNPPALGFLSRMRPAKGLELLVDAFILIRKHGRLPTLRLRVAGSMTADDEGFVAGLRAKLAAAELTGEVDWLPNVTRDEKVAFLRSLSALSVPTTYGEAFGLYVVEAWAAGVPVVQPRHAAFPELLGLTGAGVLCEPDSPESLAEKVEELLADPAAARSLGEQGRAAVGERFQVAAMAEAVERVFTGVTAAR